MFYDVILDNKASHKHSETSKMRTNKKKLSIAILLVFIKKKTLSNLLQNIRTYFWKSSNTKLNFSKSFESLFLKQCILVLSKPISNVIQQLRKQTIRKLLGEVKTFQRDGTTSHQNQTITQSTVCVEHFPIQKNNRNVTFL